MKAYSIAWKNPKGLLAEKSKGHGSQHISQTTAPSLSKIALVVSSMVGAGMADGARIFQDKDAGKLLKSINW